MSTAFQRLRNKRTHDQISTEQLNEINNISSTVDNIITSNCSSVVVAPTVVPTPQPVTILEKQIELEVPQKSKEKKKKSTTKKKKKETNTIIVSETQNVPKEVEEKLVHTTNQHVTLPSKEDYKIVNPSSGAFQIIYNTTRVNAPGASQMTVRTYCQEFCTAPNKCDVCQCLLPEQSTGEHGVGRAIGYDSTRGCYILIGKYCTWTHALQATREDKDIGDFTLRALNLSYTHNFARHVFNQDAGTETIVNHSVTTTSYPIIPHIAMSIEYVPREEKIVSLPSVPNLNDSRWAKSVNPPNIKTSTMYNKLK